MSKAVSLGGETVVSLEEAHLLAAAKENTLIVSHSENPPVFQSNWQAQS
ncbi:MAG: hypothetical protein OXI24_19340 [Candidatus Poribacteria bacterium]|nr:hypothetical protein [Candidatus Poribacteria bacterium]